MFKKYSWLIYVFIIAFLLPGNFFYFLSVKNRKAAVTYILPDKENPVNHFSIVNDRHLIDFEDGGNDIFFCYAGKAKPNIFFGIILSKTEDHLPIWNITWKGENYYDYNGDMIFDLKMPQNAREKGFMFFDGGVWKPCRAVRITGKGEILYNGKPYVFEDGRWREKPKLPMKKELKSDRKT